MQMDTKLRKWMVEFLDEKLTVAEKGWLNIHIVDELSNAQDHIVHLLTDLGAIRKAEGEYEYMLTARAWDIRWRLAHPGLAWLRDNWFSAGVLMVSVLVGIGTIVSNFIIRGAS